MINNKIKESVKEHYDFLSPYYKKLWGNHIHHGYYVTGKESKEEAQENLIKLLTKKAEIKDNSTILDIGCGIGATSIWLAKRYDARVRGITISPVQVEMAREMAEMEQLTKTPEFLVMDADRLEIDNNYDVLWAVEMISHLQERKEFFSRCAKILNKNGVMVIADWFKKEGLNKNEIEEYIEPIEKGMLVTLSTSKDYIKELESNKLVLSYHEDISEQVKKTWDLCLDIIKKKEFWQLAISHGREIVAFLKSFSSMKKGFDSKTFTYEVIIVKKL
jgi:tocopherol O-methyltransferase